MITRVRYSRLRTMLGDVLLGASERNGLCFLGMVGKRSAEAATLHDYFPHAQLTEDETVVQEYGSHVTAWLAGEEGFPPLDMRGTPFQRAVWQMLTQIPRGETRSYAELAGELGRADAVRAVAGACAANPVSLFIPCHRVVRSDGGLSGYAWGVDIKERLLAMESGKRFKRAA